MVTKSRGRPLCLVTSTNAGFETEEGSADEKTTSRGRKAKSRINNTTGEKSSQADRKELGPWEYQEKGRNETGDVEKQKGRKGGSSNRGSTKRKRGGKND